MRAGLKAGGAEAGLPEADQQAIDALLMLLRPAAWPDGAARPAAIAWDAVVRLAGPRFWPALAHGAAARGLAAPAPLQARLEAARRDNLMAWLRRRAALDGVLAPLAAHGAPAIVLKGMALARTAYEAPELRTMSDIDVWVLVEDLDVLRPALAQAGWTVPPHRDTGATDTHASVGLAHGVPPLLLELHARPGSLVEAVPARLAEIADRRVTRAGWPMLAAEDEVLHLAAHAGWHHQFTGVAPALLDLAHVLAIRGDEIDWPGATARWARDGVLPLVRVTAGAAVQAFAPPLGAAARAALELEAHHAAAASALAIALWSHATGENPAAVLAAGGPLAVARRGASQVAALLTDRDAGRPGGWRRLVRRVGQWARHAAPRHLRTLASGGLAGAAGDDRRARQVAHAALLAAIRPGAPR
jgi:hypothetical protein